MQKTISFFAEPELLILDEPTVGVDPVLRNNIWDHLVEITNTRKKTVIITTHYIEETRQAHVVSIASPELKTKNKNPLKPIWLYF